LHHPHHHVTQPFQSHIKALKASIEEVVFISVEMYTQGKKITLQATYEKCGSDITTDIIDILQPLTELYADREQRSHLPARTVLLRHKEESTQWYSGQQCLEKTTKTA